ncbi:NAC domain-containing protein 82-like [Cucurbita maxima]|uniref:NAC domain-containing protein 82-like n=1 Tax=Cucurbita maxima TaxID=3661 RepID=A0A6J1IMW9_CUCMA|nr:NAC domain-containing protein 82-like [Cucurbita maxima]XP_022979111.1 NAC domain-containing protein 82-like [Cucurbita maxima]XP_022979112.1 NAC domain-containing protein 82-like [Cucurbita maxima]
MTAISLAPGFRFYPTHVELVMYYLKKKVMRQKFLKGVISELDVYKYEPWDLPDKACLKSRDLKWYFFCPRKRKCASGARVSRTTQFGYWKSTGKDRHVAHNNKNVGRIKTLTYFSGKSSKGDPTDWVMHEYRLEEKYQSKNVSQDAYVLCVIFQKDGPGPRNGAQYGAPFKVEDWEEDGVEEMGSFEVDLSSSLSMLPSKEPLNSFAPDTSMTPSNVFGCSSASCISENLASTSKEIPQNRSGGIAPVEIPQNLDSADDLFTVEDFFPEDGNLNLMVDDGFQATVPASKHTDQNDPTYEGLGDLGARSQLNANITEDGNAYLTGNGAIYSPEQMFPIYYEAMFSSDQMPYLELNDLNAPLSDTYRDTQMSNAAYNCSSVIEQPCFHFSSFGTANQHVPSCQYPSLHHSSDQICHPTDLGYPDANMSASSQENIHSNSNGGSNGYKPPRLDHDANLP